MITKVRDMFRWSLAKYPIPTNVAVYASFYTAAELSQQTFNKYYSVAKPDYNIPAAIRIACVGSCLYAPVLYYWYRLLDQKLPGTAVKTVAIKVCCDQLIMTPILLAAFFTLMGIVEGKDDVFQELRVKYWQAFIANQSFWIPGQTVNFFFIPPHLRVVYVASVSFMWINVLCYIKRQKIAD